MRVFSFSFLIEKNNDQKIFEEKNLVNITIFKGKILALQIVKKIGNLAVNAQNGNRELLQQRCLFTLLLSMKIVIRCNIEKEVK